MSPSTQIMSKAESMLTSAVLAIDGSKSVLNVGEEGEASLRKQLSGLLGEKEMEVEELNLLYSYRFGLSIIEALKMIGFDGPLQDFAVKQKCFFVKDGRMSLAAATGIDEPQEESTKELETISNAETDSTVDDDNDKDSCCEGDSDVDIEHWHSLGGRVLTALAVSDEEQDEVDFNAGSWKEVSGRVAVALSETNESDEEEDDYPDAVEWRSVSARVSRKLSSLDSHDC